MLTAAIFLQRNHVIIYMCKYSNLASFCFKELILCNNDFFLDDFYTFAMLHPHFAEDYLYADQMGVESGLETSPLSAPNGICTDFSPDNNGDRRKPLQKKLN